MKYKIGFKLNWYEMVFVLITVFASGIIVSSQMNDKFIYAGLLILSAGGTLIKRRIKIPLEKNTLK